MKRFYIMWTAILFIGDGLCWAVADYFWTHNLIVIGDISFWMFFVVSVVSVGNMILKTWPRPKIIWFISVVVVVLAGIVMMQISIRKPPELEPTMLSPVVSPTSTQLADGEWTTEIPIDIYNPNDFPIYGTTLRLAVNGVSADSVRIKPEGMVRGLINRMNYNQTTNEEVYYQFTSGIQGKEHWKLLVGGTIPIKSDAHISIFDSKREAMPTKFKNGANDEIIPPHGVVMPPGMPVPRPAEVLTNIGIEMINSNVSVFTITVK